MAGSVRFDDTNLYVGGDLSADSMTLPDNSVSDAEVSPSAAIQRTKLKQDELQSFPISFASLRVHDALETTLPGTSANDDLGLYGGTFGTDAPTVKTYDVKTAGAVTLYARALVPLPAEYDPGASVSVRVKAGMIGAVADTSATVDVEAFALDGAGDVGSDLCSTAAQSCNSLTFANLDFVLTATALSPGDVLDVRVAVAVNDAATASAVAAAIGALELLCDIRG